MANRHCYVCKQYKDEDDFYRDASRPRTGYRQSKCKGCADFRRAVRAGWTYKGRACDTSELDYEKRYIDENYVPPERLPHLAADGVRDVRGRKSKNRPKKQIWGNKLR